MTEMSTRSDKPKPNRIREASGLVGLMLGAILFLSLISYHPSDPSWNVTGTGKTLNVLGSLGAHLSDLMFQFFGNNAYIIAGLALLFAFSMMMQRRLKLRLISVVGYCCIGLFSAALWHLLLGVSGPQQYSAGGVWGQWLADSLQAQTGVVGAYLFICMSIILALIWTTNFSFMESTSRFGRRMAPHLTSWWFRQQERFLDWRDNVEVWKDKHSKREGGSFIQMRDNQWAVAEGFSADLPALELDGVWLEPDVYKDASGRHSDSELQNLPELTPPENDIILHEEAEDSEDHPVQRDSFWSEDEAHTEAHTRAAIERSAHVEAEEFSEPSLETHLEEVPYELPSQGTPESQAIALSIESPAQTPPEICHDTMPGEHEATIERIPEPVEPVREYEHVSHWQPASDGIQATHPVIEESVVEATMDTSLAALNNVTQDEYAPLFEHILHEETLSSEYDEPVLNQTYIDEPMVQSVEELPNSQYMEAMGFLDAMDEFETPDTSEHSTLPGLDRAEFESHTTELPPEDEYTTLPALTMSDLAAISAPDEPFTSSPSAYVATPEVERCQSAAEMPSNANALHDTSPAELAIEPTTEPIGVQEAIAEAAPKKKRKRKSRKKKLEAESVQNDEAPVVETPVVEAQDAAFQAGSSAPEQPIAEIESPKKSKKRSRAKKKEEQVVAAVDTPAPLSLPNSSLSSRPPQVDAPKQMENVSNPPVSLSSIPSNESEEQWMPMLEAPILDESLLLPAEVVPVSAQDSPAVQEVLKRAEVSESPMPLLELPKEEPAKIESSSAPKSSIPAFQEPALEQDPVQTEMPFAEDKSMHIPPSVASPIGLVGVAVPEVEEEAPADGPIVQERVRGVASKDIKKVSLARWQSEGYDPPSLDFLNYVEAEEVDPELLPEHLVKNAEILEKTLENFGIRGKVTEVRPGPVITLYEYLPAPGIKVSKIAGLSDDLAMALHALQVRVIAPIPGKGVVGIELPNKKRENVYLKEILAGEDFQNTSMALPLAMGKDTTGLPYTANLAKMPHLLIAGTTGSGKSVGVNGMICSLLYHCSPEDVRFLMVDPKMLELSIYDGIPHLLLPVVTDSKQASKALNWAVSEMERRYQLMAEAGVRNITNYNKLIKKRCDARDRFKAHEEAQDRMRRQAAEELHPQDVSWEEDEDDFDLGALKDNGSPTFYEKFPYIVIIIDELADLMMVAAKEVEFAIARLAQMARAAGLHLMLATQRPSVDVLTGVIKANFPSRLAFQVKSKIDSRTILDQPGAEKLLGMGDMLLVPPGTCSPVRLHGAFVSEEEIHLIVDHLKKQGSPDYNEDILKAATAEDEDEKDPADAMYDQACNIVLSTRNASISHLQRKLRIGYNRAARIIEYMEKEKLVGPQIGSKPREVLVPPPQE